MQGTASGRKASRYQRPRRSIWAQRIFTIQRQRSIVCWARKKRASATRAMPVRRTMRWKSWWRRSKADLERLAAASGMAAQQIALQAALLGRPHHVLASHSIYGATVGMLDQMFAPFGVEVSYVDICDLDALGRAIAEKKPGCVFMESVSNPLLRVGRIDKIAELAREAGAALMVDNTFATPMLLRPLEWGANIVVHSATKYLAGHGDVLGGMVVSDREHHEKVRMLSRISGPVLGPFESYLTMRGIKTLALRYQRQCENARIIAEWLGKHSSIERVYYCADPNHPDAAAIRQFFAPDLFGAIVSFEIRGASKPSVLKFMDGLQMIVPGTSLGDVHTLLLYPFISSHRNVAPRGSRADGYS